jgi:hypothetical protein
MANMVARQIGQRWSEEGELELKLSSAVMALGEREREGGGASVAQVEEEVAGGFEMASTCFPVRGRVAAWRGTTEWWI